MIRRYNLKTGGQDNGVCASEYVRDKISNALKRSYAENEDLRQQKDTIGYLGYFETLKGFTKKLYISKSILPVLKSTFPTSS